ncbi:hypothetical protein AAEX28_14750 [Lentisphaerota bacterium WC36G]|nr:hypothetical protein LJT99_01505 [Lentisphaerae bacterium WC36]
MFKYKSVFFINLDAYDCSQGFSMGTGEDFLEIAHRKGITVYQKPFVVFGRERASLPTNTQIPLIQLNFDLARDKWNSYKKVRYHIESRMQQFETPTKIYICSHSHYKGVEIVQERDSYFDRRQHVYKLSACELSNMFVKCLPVKHSITFHFISCGSISVARYFLDSLLKKGFRNCFAVGYKHDVYTTEQFYCQPQEYYELSDFSTVDRYRHGTNSTIAAGASALPVGDHDEKILMHRREYPSLEDNNVYRRRGKGNFLSVVA